jgi:hypothetical protein
VFGRWKYVVDCFGFTILNLSLEDQWLSSSSEQKTFKAFAKRLLGEVTQRFKEVARLIVKDTYSLWVPLGFHNSISALWEAQVAELLVNWSFVDAQTTVVSFVLVLQDHDRLTPPPQSETNEIVIGVFNHPALTTLLVEAMWPPVGKLHRLIHFPGVDFNKLIAFSVAILHWALNNMKKGPKTPFEMAEYGPVYDQALEHILEIREGGDNTKLSCLNNVIHDVCAMGQAYADQYV